MRIETVWTRHRAIARCEERDRLLEVGPFAAALRSAIEVRSLSLNTLSARLDERGTPVSPSTMSAWQSGLRQPRNGPSLTALDELEALLDLPAGALRRLLAPESTSRAHHPSPAADTGPQFGTLYRISHHDLVHIGADRTQHSLVCQQVLQAEADGADRWVAIVEVEPEDPLPRFAPRENCRLGRVLRRPETGTVITEMLLDKPLLRGETVITEHEVVSAPPRPTTRFERQFGQQAREFVLEVAFAPGATPDRCHQVQQERGRPARVDEVPFDSGAELRTVALDFGPGVLGFQWSWADELPPSREG